MSDTIPPPPDYGEPWKNRRGWSSGTQEIFVPDPKIKKPFRPCKIIEVDSDIDWIKGQSTTSIAKRVVACVNACAGMADPAKEIAAMREAIREAHDALKDATDNCLWRSDSPIPLSAEESLRIYTLAMDTLAKLQPFITP